MWRRVYVSHVCSIMVPNGNIDPWHTLSVLEPNPAYNITTILIHDGAHCSNMCVLRRIVVALRRRRVN